MSLLAKLNSKIFQSSLSELCSLQKNGQHVAALLTEGQIVETFSLPKIESAEIIKLRYPIASMTKVFCAAAILKLRDNSYLRLDDEISRYVPLFNKSPWTGITIRHLLTMNSGLPYDNPWGDTLLGLKDQELLNLLEQEIYFASAPGESFNYSNLGYILLGIIIEKASGESSLSYILNNLIIPLGMGSTNWIKESDDYLLGFGPEDTIGQISAGTVKGFAGMFGGLVSNIGDLAIWINFLQSAFHESNEDFDKILSRESRLELQTPAINFPIIKSYGFSSIQSKYAFGLGVDDANGEVKIGHSGGLPGFGSHFRWSKSGRVGVIFLSNNTYFTGSKLCGEVVDKVYDNIVSEKREFLPIVKNRSEELNQIIKTLNFENLDKIFSSNFFLDNDLESFKNKLITLSKSETSKEVLQISEPGLAARLVYEKYSLYFSLSPGDGAKVQEVIFYE